MTVFDRFAGYGFVHHRALNSFAELNHVLPLIGKHPDHTHILEGDVCWDFADGAETFYFRHPGLVFDTLSAAEIRRRVAAGALVTLEDVARLLPPQAFVIAELKVGRGDRSLALQRLVAYLEQHFPGRYWIDGFSLTMLEFIKKFSPKTTVTLHTECVYRGHVLIGAPEWPPVRLRKLSELPAIDGISIRKRGSDRFMAKACADVHAAGKVLALSRLFSPDDFLRSREWGARAGYIHGDLEPYLAVERRGHAPQDHRFRV